LARQQFGGNPNGDPEAWREVLAQAGQWTGICFAIYNLVCFVFSFFLLWLSKRHCPKNIHTACLLINALGLLSASLVQSPNLLIVSMVMVGIGWASVLSMPYAMLSGAIPAAKMGFYMGVFNFFIVIPQVLVALSMGWILSTAFGGNPMMVIVSGGGALLLAAAATRLVNLNDGAELRQN
ncbi:MAG: MFS transporter, partial [Luteolibacter sp.]